MRVPLRRKLTALFLALFVVISTLGIAPVGYAVPNHAANQAKENAANRVVDLEVSQKHIEIQVGESTHLEAVATYSNGKTNSNVEWRSEAPSIVSVSEDGVVQASSTTGVATVSVTAKRGQTSKTETVQVTVYDPTKSIAHARTKVGETVTVQGIVNVDSFQLQANRLNVYIQDPTAGIQLFNFNPQNFAELEEGDFVEVTGIVGIHSGVTQITVSDIQVLAKDQTIVAKAVNIFDLSNPELAEALQGQLVTFEGYFQTVPTYYFGGANLSAIDEDFNTMVLRAWESTGIVLEDIDPQNWYEITGIVSKYNNTYQILPRKASDITISEEQQPKPSTNQREFEVTVARVVDGDTIRIVEPVFGATNVRFLNIDTAETYQAIRNDLDQHQMDQGKRAGEYLQNYLSEGDKVIVRLGEEPLDGYGRLLAEVIAIDQNGERINTNLEMVRAGEAVTYFIYPFEQETVATYAEAAKFARDNGLGIWNPEDPLLEEPFVFRARERGDTTLSRFVGNFETKEYVEPNQYAIIPAENRVFFREHEAKKLGYEKKELTNEELAAVDTNSVKLQVLANHNVTRITDNMTLPVKALYGSTIEWKSSHPEVIGNDGVINKSLEERTMVTLTATVTNGDANQQLQLSVTVLEPIIEIISWDFEDQNAIADGGTVANVNRSITRESAINPTYPAGTGGSGTFAYNTNSWNDGAGEKFYKINFETIGFKNIKLSSKQNGSNTGPRDFKLQYSLDGSDWKDLGKEIVVANNWNAGVVDNLTLPTEVENKENVYIRWLMTSNTSINGGTVASGGTNRIDDIVISGNPATLSDELAVELDRNNLQIIFQEEDNAQSVTKDILLPATGINGSVVNWTSSNSEVISNEGVVTRFDQDVPVTLTATVTKGENSITKVFDLVVVGLHSNEGIVVEPLIGYWNFNASGFGKLVTSGKTLESDKGSALLRSNFANISEFQGDTLNALNGDLAGNSLSLVSNANNGKFVELEFSSKDLQNVVISFATRGTGTGFNKHQWKYSLDGKNFVEFGENTANTTATWQLKSVTLPSYADNQDVVLVRVYFDGATGSTGNNRVDNLQINGIVTE
ncbi:MAG: thermonuclease family protein [Bacillaceae bacterium]|nr:thermonuclease family protein [Bacillaceae bacterium]